MPLVSQRQQRYMFANHPKIAKKMADGMKGKGGRSKAHPLKGLPKQSNSKAARRARAKSGRARRRR